MPPSPLEKESASHVFPTLSMNESPPTLMWYGENGISIDGAKDGTDEVDGATDGIGLYLRRCR